MAQDFSVLFSTRIDTKTAKQQIDAFIKDSKNRNINVKVNADTKSIQTLENNLKNVSESAKQATSKLSVDPKVEQTWRNLTTVTTSYVDAQGNLHSKINTVNRDLSQSTEYVKTYATSFGKANNSLNEFKTNVENANSLLQRLKDTHPFEGITTNCERGKVAVEELNTTVAKASTTMNDFSFSFGKLGSSIIDATKKVALFKISTTFVSAFYNSLREAVEVVKDYNATMTEFLKVTTLSSDGVKELETSLTNIGENVGRTRNELLGISTELTKAGFQSKQELETLSELVAMYQNTADEELSVAEASSVLISMMKAFNIEADEAIHITDAINQVSQDFAVSSGDLGKGLTQAGAALATYGNNFNETIGLLAGGTEVFQHRSQQVARALNTISSRIVQHEADLKQYGIELNDVVTGDLRSTTDILTDLSKQWDSMSHAQQVNLGLALSGVQQYKVFSAIMGNFETVLRATEDAENSQGATLRQNEVYMQSLEALTNKLKQQFEQLVLGTGQLENLAKDIVNITTNILKLTNAVGGLNTIFVALVGVLATIKANNIAKFFSNIPNLALKAKMEIVGYTQALKEAVAGEQALTAQSEVTGVALTNLQLIVGALTAVITIGVMAFNAYKQANEEMWDSYTSTAEKSAETAKTNADALKKYNEILDDEDVSLGQLESALTSIDEKYKDQLDAIDDVNEKRKEAIRLLKEEAEGYNSNNAEEVYNENIKAYKEAQKKLGEASYYSAGESLTMTGGFGDENSKAEATAFQAVQRAQGYDEEKQALENLIATYEGFQQKQDISISQYETYGIKINEAKDKLTALDEKYADQISVIQNTNEALARYEYVLTETSDGTLDLVHNKNEANKILKESESNVLAEAQALMDLQDAYGITATQVEEYIKLHPELNQEAEEAGESVEYLATVALAETYENAELATQSVADLATELASMQDKYNTLRGAVDEYNSTGTITSSTLKELLALGDEYTSLLTTENGKLSLNEEGFINLADAMKQQMLQEVATETVTKMLEVAQDDLKGTTEDSGKAATNAADNYSNLVPVLTDVANKAISASAGMQSFMDVLAGKGFNVEGLSKKAQDEMNQVYKEGVAKAELITAVQDKFNKNYESGSKKRSSSSKKSSKESKDAWLEAYKAEKDALESLYKTNVITAEEYAQKLEELSDKYLTDSADHQKKYAKEIHDAYEAMYTALKKSAKEALDEEEKRLKKQLDDIKDEAKAREKDLKRAHDSEEKAIKKKIDTQKEYNKEVLKGIKSQIDALKREKDATKDSYNKRIDTLKTEREEYERQVKLMQLKEELAKAKSTMQYVMDETGKFTYQEDSTAVDQAQENLIEEERKQQYERELSALEDARDNADEIYEQRIQSLEDYYDSVKEQQDKAIDQMEKYLDEVKDRHDQEEQALSDHYDALEAEYERNYNDFKDNADKYLNGQMQLTNNENSEWGRRLQNLANFVNEYNALMNSLNNGSTSNSSNYKGSSSSGSSIKSSSKKSSSIKKASKKSKRASGDASISSDGMYLVGDSPNQELVIGSKLNGVPLSLSRGDGVVNAKSTNTLAGILNMIGGIAKPLAPNQTNNNSTSNITISNVSLPNVHNGEEFINCLQHFDIDMMQRSYDTY